MRSAAFSAALVLLLSAGCAAPATPPPPTTPTPEPPATYAWGISGCSFVIASVQVDPDRLAARLPPGFALRPNPLSGLPAGPRGILELDAYACESGAGLGGTLRPLAYGSYYATVTPPDALREPGVGAYFVKWDFLVPDEARRTAWVAAGLPARAGSAEVSLPPASGGPLTVSQAMEGAGGFRLTGVLGPLDPPGEPLPFMEYTPLAPGGALARWHARLHDARIGQGSGEVEVLPGSWAADVVGAQRAPATFIAGSWNLDQADVTFPVPWPPGPGR